MYTLSTGWDLSTASLLLSYDVGAEVDFPEGLALKGDESQLYVCGTDDAQGTVDSYTKSFSGAARASTRRD